MQCPECETRLENEAEFCTECGAELGASDVAPDGGTSDDPAAEEYTVLAEHQGFFEEDELSSTLKVARRGSLFVTDSELVCGYDETYRRTILDGVPLIGIFRSIAGKRYSGVSLEEALRHEDSIRVSLSDITDVSVEKTANVPLAARDVMVRTADREVAIRPGRTLSESGKTGPAKDFAEDLRAAARDAGADV